MISPNIEFLALMRIGKRKMAITKVNQDVSGHSFSLNMSGHSYYLDSLNTISLAANSMPSKPIKSYKRRVNEVNNIFILLL
jgi:hypothetical protein